MRASTNVEDRRLPPDEQATHMTEFVKEYNNSLKSLKDFKEFYDKYGYNTSLNLTQHLIDKGGEVDKPIVQFLHQQHALFSAGSEYEAGFTKRLIERGKNVTHNPLGDEGGLSDLMAQEQRNNIFQEAVMKTIKEVKPVKKKGK